MSKERVFIIGDVSPYENEELDLIFINNETVNLTKYLVDNDMLNRYEICNHNITNGLKDSDTFIFINNLTTIENRLKEPLIPYSSKVLTMKTLDLEKLDLEEEYKIFSGKSISNLSKETKIQVLKIVVDLSRVLYQFLEAGYLELENNERIDDWIVLFQEPFLDCFIRYHKFYSSSPDVPITDEFIINPKFRKEILIAIMKILANFIINNDLITEEDLSGFEVWEDKNLWIELKGKVKIFQK